MNKRLKLIAGIFWVTTINCYAQIKEFDPLLDSKVTVIPAPSQEEWNSNYMWYPGQLAAFYQQQSAKISKERCVNVGYPGKFFAKNNRAYFKREIKLHKENNLRWEGPSDIILYVNGIKQSTTNKQITLPAGKSSLLFEVITNDSLPCIILKGDGMENPNEWQVSMDKTTGPFLRVPPCIISPPLDQMLLKT